MTGYKIKEEGIFEYIEEGQGNASSIVLLHGLFGTASNFDHLISHFSSRMHVIMPVLPIFKMPIKEVSLEGLLSYLEEFIETRKLEGFHLLGNSLGGHIALLYALKHQEKLGTLILTGSSGLYESAFGTSFPKRENYDFIKKKIQLTFYDQSIVTEEMAREVFEIVNDRNRGIRIIKTAKSAIRHNVADRLGEINIPTLLVWGKQDTITPPFVAKKFNQLIEDSRLIMIDKCGHAAMLERPIEFNEILEEFLQDQVVSI